MSTSLEDWRYIDEQADEIARLRSRLAAVTQTRDALRLEIDHWKGQARKLAEYVNSTDTRFLSSDIGYLARQILADAEPVTPARSEEKCNACVGTGKELIDCAGSAGYRTCEQCEGTGRAAKKAARCTQGRSQGTGGAQMTTETKSDCQMCEELRAENERLKRTLDGDPSQHATKEQREAWRFSAIKYSNKLESQLAEATKHVLAAQHDTVKDVHLNNELVSQLGRVMAERDVAREQARELRRLVEIFVRKGTYHMQQWPGDKEMHHTIEAADKILAGDALAKARGEK